MSVNSNPHTGLREMVVRCAKGNPGALTAVVRSYGAGGGAWEMVKICDELGIYGSRLYQLWNDCLGRDPAKMADCAMGYRAGKIDAAFILEQIQGDGCRGYAFEPEEVIAAWTES